LFRQEFGPHTLCEALKFFCLRDFVPIDYSTAVLCSEFVRNTADQIEYLLTLSPRLREDIVRRPIPASYEIVQCEQPVGNDDKVIVILQLILFKQGRDVLGLRDFASHARAHEGGITDVDDAHHIADRVFSPSKARSRGFPNLGTMARDVCPCGWGARQFRMEATAAVAWTKKSFR